MTVVNFTKKQNVLTEGGDIFGEAKSTDSRAMGFWTDGRTHARTDAILRKLIDRFVGKNGVRNEIVLDPIIFW